MKKLLFDCGTRDATASLGLLFLRVAVGLMMLIGHGWGKVENFAKLKDGFPVPQFFPLYHMSPPVSLIATIGAEVVFAGLLALGVMTRISAFILGFTMVVAAFHVQAALPFFYSPPDTLVAKELAVMYLIPCMAILLAGGGAYSLDATLVKEGRRKFR
ncbi:MAG: DoxX family protein [Luteolibacter sp.]|jgi:putative oxidoreductase